MAKTEKKQLLFPEPGSQVTPAPTQSVQTLHSQLALRIPIDFAIIKLPPPQKKDFSRVTGNGNVGVLGVQKKMGKAPERERFSVSMFAKPAIPNSKHFIIFHDFTSQEFRPGLTSDSPVLCDTDRGHCMILSWLNRGAALEDPRWLHSHVWHLGRFAQDTQPTSAGGFEPRLSDSTALPSSGPSPHPRRLTHRDSTPLGIDRWSPKPCGFQPWPLGAPLPAGGWREGGDSEE